MRNISQELESHGLYTDPGLFDFLQAGIEQGKRPSFISQKICPKHYLHMQTGKVRHIERI